MHGIPALFLLTRRVAALSASAHAVAREPAEYEETTSWPAPAGKTCSLAQTSDKIDLSDASRSEAELSHSGKAAAEAWSFGRGSWAIQSAIGRLLIASWVQKYGR